ncbi:hypothetical protein PR202_ga10226 [Eleusine coracana subsp. coracana]|uniref:4a-hydroxytetrahydrobiopterin dehydratase n=1 Tax=Eleusine coracana subsp. coracana TaxID=191504 RepID=A0AAV5C662_ELECO|nr:hypothetical protein PR202_ga10226 [Eleusine coracana subsp. coracana]
MSPFAVATPFSSGAAASWLLPPRKPRRHSPFSVPGRFVSAIRTRPSAGTQRRAWSSVAESKSRSAVPPAPMAAEARGSERIEARYPTLKILKLKKYKLQPGCLGVSLVELQGEQDATKAKAAPTLHLVSWNSSLFGRGRLCICFISELAEKSCVPCNSKDLHPMSEDSAKRLLEQVNGWELTTEDGILKLHRAWKVKNFVKGLEFFQLVAAIAEGEGHHPDLHLVGWNNVKIDVWTHSIKGLTENDFVLAAKINHLNLEGLLSKKKANVYK